MALSKNMTGLIRYSYRVPGCHPAVRWAPCLRGTARGSITGMCCRRVWGISAVSWASCFHHMLYAATALATTQVCCYLIQRWATFPLVDRCGGASAPAPLSPIREQRQHSSLFYGTYVSCKRNDLTETNTIFWVTHSAFCLEKNKNLVRQLPTST